MKKIIFLQLFLCICTIFSGTPYDDAIIAYQNGQYDLARTFFNDAMEYNNNLIYELNTSGLTYYELKQQGYDMDWIISVADSQRNYANYYLAYIDLYQGNIESAIDTMNKVETGTDKKFQADILVFYSDCHSVLKQYQKAMDYLNEAINTLPDHSTIYLKRAILHEQLQNPEAALRDYTAAIKYEEGSDSYFRRGVFLQKYTHLKESIDDFTIAIVRAPENYQYYSFRGKSYFFLKDFTKSSADFESAYKIHQEDAQILLFLTMSHIGLKDYKKARKYANLALKNFPEVAAGYYLFGYILKKEGKNKYDNYFQDARTRDSDGAVHKEINTIFEAVGIEKF